MAEFGRVVGAPHYCPPEWTIDPLKVACILRLADGTQIDARRAPILVRHITSLSASAEPRWQFQQKLNKPYLNEDSLVFTAGRPFSLAEAESWWLCLDVLRMIDRELRSVDSLFADKGYARFAARRVAGVESPDRLVPYVETDGWLPINAMVSPYKTLLVTARARAQSGSAESGRRCGFESRPGVLNRAEPVSDF